MPREHFRSQSPVSRPTGDRHYRDRSDYPKRKHNSDEALARKRVQLPKKEKEYPSINELKKRIRDVKRLLNRVDLPADARIVQERALAGYENDLEEETNRRERSAMIKRYHFVRFLDRKTATKDIKTLERHEKEISSSDLDAVSKEQKLSAIAQKLHDAHVNLNYTIYYPLAEKYFALYAEVKKKKDQAKDGDHGAGYKLVHATAAEKPAMWHVVEKCMKDGTLDLLREGKLTIGNENGKSVVETKKSGEDKKKKDASAKTDVKSQRGDKYGNSKGAASRDANRNTRARRSPSVNDDNDSDGGFFEM